MVSLVASRLADPVLTGVRVRADGVRLSKMLPAGPVDVFAGQDLVVLARYEGSGRAQVRFDGATSDGPVSWVSTGDFPERERGNSFVPRLWATQRIGYLSAERRQHGGSQELDDEIRELGERYGIPTEFTSYLVREPDMIAQQRNRRVGPGRMGGLAGGVAPAAPAAAPAPTREQAFDAAKAAAAQRSAVTLQDVDAADRAATSAMGGSGAERTARVGRRVFALRDGVWVDAAAEQQQSGARVVRVRAYSDAYFKLLDLVPELRPIFALGERVVVAGRAVTIELAPDGSETLGDRELRAVRDEW
jgi:Ca-activated chloride channel family protein